MFFFFFFQAEDGIRDADVTGVQTCALPISTIGTLEKIADALGVPVTELFEKSNTEDIVGFVKVGDTIHEVKSAEDVKDLAGKL